jgi:hypothetical protein
VRNSPDDRTFPIFAENVMKQPTRTILVAGTLLLSGCAPAEKLILSSGPAPRVENCAQIQQATPTRYVCNGKTYTSVQLSNIRSGVSL